MPTPSAIHQEKPLWTDEQCRSYLQRRFASVLDAPHDGLSFPDEHYANELRDVGNRYKQSHLNAYDKIYDKIDDGVPVKTACKQVLHEMEASLNFINEEWFRVAFYRFRRNHEIRVRRMLVIGAMFDHDIERGVVQCVRLSRRVDPREVLEPN